MKAVRGLMAVAGMVLVGASAGAYAQDNDLYEKAKSEGNVTLYSATDTAQVQSMIDAFKAKYPGIEVDYNDVGPEGTFNRVISEAAANQVGADLVWSSAMDRQMLLAQQGLFEAVELPEAKAIPDWGNFKNVLYATSVEPIGIIFNKNVLAEDKVPTTRAELIAYMKSDEAKDKVAALDPERSPSGFQFDTNDAKTTDNFWDVVAAFGAAGGKTYTSNGPVKESIDSGENALAFNIIGSYAIEWAKSSPSLGVMFDKERTAAFSRVIGFTKGAPHPNAGKLFLNFLLSQEGQAELARNGLPSVRTDIDASIGFDFDSINERVGGHMQPIPLDETLVTDMDNAKRAEFLTKWRDLVRNGG